LPTRHNDFITMFWKGKQAPSQTKIRRRNQQPWKMMEEDGLSSRA
jgi:hypothetical protein